MKRLQVVLSVTEPLRLVAGLPVPVRAADVFRNGLKADRLIFCAPSHSLIARWGAKLADLPWLLLSRDGDGRPLQDILSPDGSALLLAPEAVPEPAALKGFLDKAAALSGPAALVDRGGILAAFYPDASKLRAALDEDGREFPRAALTSAAESEAIQAEAGSSGWHRVRGPEDASRMEERIFKALPQSADGYIARFDRRISIALSRLLLPLPITPNQITAAGLLIGLAGAWLLAGRSYPLQMLGAALLCSCCILDGCDGELARLKLMCSPAGERCDLIADNLVHLAIFIAVPVHIQRMRPDADFAGPGLLLVSGFLLSAFWVWRLVLRLPNRTKEALFIERIASRDFIYLVLILTALRRLEWFLWAAAFGSHLFWLALVLLKAAPRGEGGKA
ncbi:MAG: CDP-alcohol phosphatidyltransferase family protein [Elusimicrobia bacterium]|nr:CDP-alcohol phosphatidyltransferase family protein [Elusimicrobiota bacterium]